jgi:hypothetical protein
MSTHLVLWNASATPVEAPNEKLGVAFTGLRERQPRAQRSCGVVTLGGLQLFAHNSGHGYPKFWVTDSGGAEPVPQPEEEAPTSQLGSCHRLAT